MAKKLQENSLANIKRWLDLPLYLQYIEDEETLDAIIIMTGLSEAELKNSNSFKTDNLSTLDPKTTFQIDWSHDDVIFVQGPTGKLIRKEVTIHHYSVPISWSTQLIRALLNIKNPELAKYGYKLYNISSEIGDFYVPFTKHYSLYINYDAYMKDDYKKVNEGIIKGIENTTEYTKVLNNSTKAAVIKKLYNSDLYKNVLKLKRT